MSEKQLMLGNEAVARGAYEAGATVATAYPGTPSTEITETIAQYKDIYSEWSPNEKVALEVALGASVAGARTICSMKHVGLNVAADPLFTASYTGVSGGLVIVTADDPGMHSSQNEQDNRNYAKAAKLPMLEPADSAECREYTMAAFELSERFDCPVLLRLTTRIAHSRSIVETGEKKPYSLKEYKKDVWKYVMMPAMARKRHEFAEERTLALKAYAETLPFNEIIHTEGKSGSTPKPVGVISSGAAYQYAREAFRDTDALFLKLGMVYPLPERKIKEFAAQVGRIYIVEELDPFIEEQVRAMGIDNEIYGKNVFPITGELSAAFIKTVIKEAGQSDAVQSSAVQSSAVQSGSEVQSPSLPARPPVMCPGCPHRGLFYVLKKLKLNIIGDIGCYTLGALPPMEAMDTCVCMGAGIGMAHGMEKARGTEFARKTVAVIGESTFIHSGITGLIDIAYNKGTSTVIILDNSITGMTGHQQNPSTGYTIKGEETWKADLVQLARASGFARVTVIDPFDLKNSEKVIREELAAEEPSVVIAARPCALLKYVKFGKPLMINREKCRTCRRCLAIGCPAIADKGDYLEVNSALCVGCRLCTELCSFGAFEEID